MFEGNLAMQNSGYENYGYGLCKIPTVSIPTISNLLHLE